MRVAVLSDIHGNLPALEAVLAELDADPPDAIAVAGDIVLGPFPAECLAVVRARPEPVHWVKGNAERDVVQSFDGDEVDDERRTRRHSAAALDRADRDELDSWPVALSLHGVSICHGSPRSVDEVLTRGTPDAVLREALHDAAEPLVVGGHTHQQVLRALEGGPTYANGGSIGRPYDGSGAAFWMVVQDGRPTLRRTPYDIAAAIERMRGSDYPALDDYLDGCLVSPLDPDWVTAWFEYGAGRGPDPGPERRIG
jgi:predicted phosphodiesterase